MTFKNNRENNKRIWNNGSFIADKKTDMGGGPKTGNLFKVALWYNWVYVILISFNFVHP